MALLSVISRWYFSKGMPIREITRRTRLSRNMVRKYLASGVVEPRYPNRKIRSKLDGYESGCDWIVPGRASAGGIRGRFDLHH